MNRDSLLSQPLFVEWLVSEEPEQVIIARDRDIPSGQGFRLSLGESSLHYQASIEFENFASRLISHAEAQINNGVPQWMAGILENDQLLKFRIFRRSVETNFGVSQNDGISLQLERRKSASFSGINFIDYVASFVYFLFPYTVHGQAEGAEITGTQTSHERSSMNRAICLAYHGYTCKACLVNLQERYGQVAKDYIHVHHLNPVASAGEIKPDPIKDMVPLCPNCHGIAHLRTPPYSVQEIQNMIARNND